jgi:hypothetical protein
LPVIQSSCKVFVVLFPPLYVILRYPQRVETPEADSHRKSKRGLTWVRRANVRSAERLGAPSPTSPSLVATPRRPPAPRRSRSMALTGTRRRCLFRQPDLRNTYTYIEQRGWQKMITCCLLQFAVIFLEGASV